MDSISRKTFLTKIKIEMLLLVLEVILQNTIWLFFIVMAILLWSATSLLYKAGIHGNKEEHICLKYSVCVGLVFFVIAVLHLIMC